MPKTVFRYPEDITWCLPCLFQYESLITIIQTNIKKTLNKILKTELYGAPSSVWSGGRIPAVYEELSEKQLTNLFKYIGEYNATAVFAFNCTKITKETLKDRYANMLLDFALEHNSKFMVYSDILRDYIKEKKSDAFVISSVLKPVFYFQGPNRIENPDPQKETEYYNKLLKEYDMVSVRPEYSKFILANDTTLIDDLSKIQVLINQSCICNCVSAPDHALFNESYNVEKNENYQFVCQRTNMSAIARYQNNSMHTKDEIEALYKGGVRNFKLKGRGGSDSTYQIIHMLLNTMIRTDGCNYIFIQYIDEDTLKSESKNFADKVINA